MSAAPTPRHALAAIPAYVPGRRASGSAIAPLASNENPHPPLPSVLDAVAAAATRANRYPDAACADVREALAARLNVTSAAIAVGPGSVGLLQQLTSAFCDEGDEVVFAWRSFEAYPIVTRLAGAVPVQVPLTADERHDLDAMAAAITDRTRIVICCSPNNPTGTVIGQAELERFLTQVPAEVLVVVDEAYVEFATNAADTISLIASHPNVCVLRTFSKAYGLAGLRIGYAVAHPDVTDALRRTGMPFAVSSVAQAAALASLAADTELADRVESIVAERSRLIDALTEVGWRVPESGGNSLWLRLDDEQADRLAAAFDDADVLVRRYAGDGIRISVGDPFDNDRAIVVMTKNAPAPADGGPR